MPGLLLLESFEVPDVDLDSLSSLNEKTSRAPQYVSQVCGRISCGLPRVITTTLLIFPRSSNAIRYEGRDSRYTKIRPCFEEVMHGDLFLTVVLSLASIRGTKHFDIFSMLM